MNLLSTATLVKITSYLSLEDFKSLRLVSFNVRNKTRLFIFWKIYYTHIFGKKLQQGDLILWEDISKLDYYTRTYNTYKSNIIRCSFNKKLSQANPRLLEIYLYLLDIDMLNREMYPAKYLFHHIHLDEFEHNYSVNEIATAKLTREFFIKRSAEILATTPSENFSMGIYHLAKEINNVQVFDYEDTEDEDNHTPTLILEKYTHLTFSHIKSLIKNKVLAVEIHQYLTIWRSRLEAMKMTEAFDSYYAVDTVMEYVEHVKEPYKGTIEKFFEKFLSPT